MFNIGDKLTKANYTQAAIWCNENNAIIVKAGDGYVIAAIPEPTAEELAQARIAELKQHLADTDYIIIKIAEGSATAEEYAEIIEIRRLWRTEINSLEEDNNNGEA